MILNKKMTLWLIILITPIIGGLYGILNDQLTYTISPEFYTKLKFYQFGLMEIGNEPIFRNPRIEVAEVGFMATWWIGLPIGLILGFVGLIHEDSKEMLRVTLRAIVVTAIVAFASGLVGLAYGKFHLAMRGVSGWLPDNLIDKENFIAVGSMHDFSYFGGLIGVIIGAIYSVRQKRDDATTDMGSNKNAENNGRFIKGEQYEIPTG